MCVAQSANINIDVCLCAGVTGHCRIRGDGHSEIPKITIHKMRPSLSLSLTHHMRTIEYCWRRLRVLAVG